MLLFMPKQKAEDRGGGGSGLIGLPCNDRAITEDDGIAGTISFFFNLVAFSQEKLVLHFNFLKILPATRKCS